jgi:hypothetical protein
MLHGTPSRSSRSPHAAGHRHPAGNRAAGNRAADRAAGDTKVAGRPRHSRAQHSRVAPRPSRTRPLALSAGGALALPRAAVLPVSPQWAAQALTRALAALIVAAVFGMIAFFIVAHVRRDDSPADVADVLPRARPTPLR